MTYREAFNRKYGFPASASHSLEEIADLTGHPLDGLKTIQKKGEGAFFSNPQSVRPSVSSPAQWGRGRVYSAVMGGKAQRIDKSHLELGSDGEKLRGKRMVTRTMD